MSADFGLEGFYRISGDKRFTGNSLFLNPRGCGFKTAVHFADLLEFIDQLLSSVGAVGPFFLIDSMALIAEALLL